MLNLPFMVIFSTYFRTFCIEILAISFFLCNFAPAFEAQMAESVDALVSNTSGATRAGSTPALGTIKNPCTTHNG